MNKKSVFLSLIFVSVMLLNFLKCQTDNNDFSISNWKKEIIEKRKNKDKEFKNSPTTPFAGLIRLTAVKDRKNYLDYNDGLYQISEKKLNEILICISWEKDKWLIKSFNSEFQGLSSDTSINSESYLSNRTVCSYKKYTLVLYPLDNNVVIIVFDPEREALQEFRYLKYYPPDPDYRVSAEFRRFNNFEKIKMTTSQNQIKTFYRYAKMIFTIKDQEQFLIAYKMDLNQKPGEALLFIPFIDKTSGITTYPAGRFIEMKEPVKDKFIFDFNEAFNPLCNYSHVYNCPYPPDENFLDIPIEAGEKKYPVRH